MADTNIEWAEKVWNPITGCSKLSPGCDHCYAERMAHRLAGRCGYPEVHPFQVTFHKDKLNSPLSWKRGKRIFVNSMGDLFHPGVKAEWVEEVLRVMDGCPQHTFMVLTKRPEQAMQFFTGRVSRPIANLWFGVTAENQKTADDRTYILRNIPAAVRFVSVEPMLGPVSLELFDYRIDWVICGAETGPKARYMDPTWAKSLYTQCRDAHVPFFMKKMSGGLAIPNGLMVRELP